MEDTNHKRFVQCTASVQKGEFRDSFKFLVKKQAFHSSLGKYSSSITKW